MTRTHIALKLNEGQGKAGLTSQIKRIQSAINRREARGTDCSTWMHNTMSEEGQCVFVRGKTKREY
jgi:hypothetical protein